MFMTSCIIHVYRTILCECYWIKRTSCTSARRLHISLPITQRIWVKENQFCVVNFNIRVHWRNIKLKDKNLFVIFTFFTIFHIFLYLFHYINCFNLQNVFTKLYIYNTYKWTKICIFYWWSGWSFWRCLVVYRVLNLVWIFIIDFVM